MTTCLVSHASSPVLEFMKKLGAGLNGCKHNYVRELYLDEWVDIAEAWQAAGKPLPSEFEHVNCPRGSECMAELYVWRCLELRQSLYRLEILDCCPIRIPLLMLGTDRKFHRLEPRVEECCYKLFRYIILTNPDVPCAKAFVKRPEIVFAVAEHMPECLTRRERFEFPWSDVNVSVASVVVASFAGWSERFRSAMCLHVVEFLLDLPCIRARGDAFFLEVETACEAAFYSDDEHFMQLVKTVLAELKRRDEAWERRSHWIHACVQIGLHSV